MAIHATPKSLGIGFKKHFSQSTVEISSQKNPKMMIHNIKKEHFLFNMSISYTLA